MNLLEETIEELRQYGRTLDDVVWIGTEAVEITKENFIKCADVEYYDGYGAPEVATDLRIVGNDFYMTRGEYDGKEWWDFHTIPNRPNKVVEVDTLVCGDKFVGWRGLMELNGEPDPERLW